MLLCEQQGVHILLITQYPHHADLWSDNVTSLAHSTKKRMYVL